MAINFSDKLLVTNPTSYHLGRGVLIAGLLEILTGAITYYTGEFLMPDMAWCALGAPTAVIGFFLWRSGLTRN